MILLRALYGVFCRDKIKSKGLDVADVVPGVVLYDTNTHQYYTPVANAMSGAEMEKSLKVKSHIIVFEESGSSDL